MITIKQYADFCKRLGIKASSGFSISTFIEVCKIPKNYECYRNKEN